MPSESSPSDLIFGYATPVDLWQSPFEQKHRTLEQLAGAGVDQIFMADHVSFRTGHGTETHA